MRDRALQLHERLGGVPLQKRVAIWPILGLLIVAGSFVRAGLPFFTLSEVRPGQKGLGYTVVYGTEVKPFAVEILGVIQNKSRDRSFILVKVSGGILRESKGIAAGMSGSPVFVDGRLAGAIGYAFDRSDPQYGLVTPIEDMLRLWERGSASANGGIALAPSAVLPPGCRTAVPVVTPLLVSGGRIPDELAALGRNLGLTPIATAETLGTGDQIAPPLQPGSAVAVVFALGDYNAVAIGTVTWLDGQRFLAFGHPVANRGLVDYPAAGAFIHQVISSLDIPFKVGVPLNQVGRFVQDRGAGASGIAGEAADTVLAKATVQDKGSGRHRTYQSAIVREPVLLRPICLASLLDAIDQTLDQYAAGTVRVTLRIEAEGLEGPLVRRNLFYDGKDVATVSLSEVGGAIDLLTQNDFREVRLKSVALEVGFTPAPLVATVVRARASRERVKPGDQVQVEVELRPFRAAAIVVPFTVTIPANASAGKLILTVRGGYVPTQDDGQNKDQAGFSQLFETKVPATLAEQVAAFTDRPRNNDLILEYLPFARDQNENDSEAEPIVLIQGCDFVVKGETQLILEVQAPAPPEPKQTI